jgi:two-component system, chemotaxis family, chemotaxis protein CheY
MYVLFFLSYLQHHIPALTPLVPKELYGRETAHATGIFRQNRLANLRVRVFDSPGFGMSPAKSNQTDKAPATIFVVDDEPMLLELAMTILQPLGFNVRAFRDPKQALAEYPAAKPAIVVTDFAMGEMNGMELVRECKRINPRQKTILLSGTVTEQVFASAQHKPDFFLAKPYQVSEFVESVQALLKA